MQPGRARETPLLLPLTPAPPTRYEEEILLGAVLDKLDEQAAAEDEDPLFMFYSTHLTHMPLQVPQEYLDKFGDITNEYRQSMRAMSYVASERGGKGGCSASASASARGLPPRT